MIAALISVDSAPSGLGEHSLRSSYRCFVNLSRLRISEIVVQERFYTIQIEHIR